MFSHSEARIAGARSAANTFVPDGLLPETVLSRSAAPDKDDRLPAIVAGMKGADPNMTLQAIWDRLDAMRERTPRGRTKWQPSLVDMILERARKLGILSSVTLFGTHWAKEHSTDRLGMRIAFVALADTIAVVRCGKALLRLHRNFL